MKQGCCLSYVDLEFIARKFIKEYENGAQVNLEKPFVHLCIGEEKSSHDLNLKKM